MNDCFTCGWKYAYHCYYHRKKHPGYPNKGCNEYVHKDTPKGRIPRIGILKLVDLKTHKVYSKIGLKR